MGDQPYIQALISLASDHEKFLAVQDTAAKRLLRYDGEVYPRDGCAITLSVLLQNVGIDLGDIYQAFALGNILKSKRKWQIISLGEQKPGDVGSTCGQTPKHGTDHIYLVLQVKDSDGMVIADNQQPVPHLRYVSGKGGKSPTKFFLRAT